MLVSDIIPLVSDTACYYHYYTSHPRSSHLKAEERTELTKLLTTFSQVFAEDLIPTGHTSVVKHCIPATGPPIRQPLRWIPQPLKNVVYSVCWTMMSFTQVTVHGPLQLLWRRRKMEAGGSVLIIIS